MDALPSGEVTFLFSDVEGSTARWERDPDGMRDALAVHDGCSRAAVHAHGGSVVKGTGDGVFAVFGTPRAAVSAAIELQRSLAVADWPGEEPLRVRIGIHSGTAVPREGDYLDPAVNRCARVMGAAWGGQVLVSSDTATALAGSVGIELRDLGFHRLRDLVRATRLYQVLHPDLAADFPPLRTLDGFPNNLPKAASSLLGRDAELTELGEAVAADRLVTLTGAGGVGKTRLAAQLGAEILERHPDGVWLVELGTLQTPELIANAVTGALRVPDRPGHPTEEVLATFVADRDLVVILDNCEHVLGAVAPLVERLLRGAPDLRMVATSREPLGLPGERVHAVQPLPVVGEGSATELFLTRAAAASREFDPAVVDPETVATICRRLDGLPLAIELAASRVRVMSVEEIARRLDDRFRLLTGGSRSALPRQRTLEATVAWSYELLQESEQRLFRFLAVFASPFRITDAESVVSGDGLYGSIDEVDVLGGVLELADRSLLVAETQAEDTRYRMLETIRAYARERLAESGQSEVLRGAHADWALKRAREAARHLDGPEQAAWLKSVDLTIDDLRAAMSWGEGSEASERGARIATYLYRYWYLRSVREGLGWFERFADQAEGFSAATAAKLRYSIGSLLQVMGRYEAAVDQLGAAVAIYRDLDDPRGLAYSLHELGRALWGRAPQTEVMQRFHEALAIFRSVGDAVGEGLALLFMATDEGITHGRLDAALRLADECEEIMRSIGAPYLVAHAAETRACVLWRAERPADAVPLLREAAGIYAGLGSPLCGAHFLENTAGLLARISPEDALRVLAATQRLRDRTGIPPPAYENLSFAEAQRIAEEMLTPDAAQAAWQQGTRLGFRAALQLADEALSATSA